MGDHSTDAVAGTRFRGRTVRIVVTMEAVDDLRRLAQPIADALQDAGASVRMQSFEADAEITPFDPPYELGCPLCDGSMVAAPARGHVILECIGECRRAWSAPRREASL